jgi:hypothetical protein
MVPCFRRDGVWTPAFAGVTALVTFCESIINYEEDDYDPGQFK